MTFVTRPIASSTKVEPSARHFGGGDAIGLAGFREKWKLCCLVHNIETLAKNGYAA
jgi:hypothetical protein